MPEPITTALENTSWKSRFYSQTGCFFLIGTLQTSPGTLEIGWQFESSKLQPARASCNLHEQVAQFICYLVARTRWDFPKCFKCYFNIMKTGLRDFAWMSHWTTTKIFSIAWKKLNSFFQGIYDQQIVISYKDLSLQVFTGVDVDRNFSLHVSEASKNALLCGSDIYQQVYLKVRESDPPFLSYFFVKKYLLGLGQTSNPTRI